MERDKIIEELTAGICEVTWLDSFSVEHSVMGTLSTNHLDDEFPNPYEDTPNIVSLWNINDEDWIEISNIKIVEVERLTGIGIKDDVDKIEIVYKPGIEPPDDIIYCDADHEAMDEINKEINQTTDPLSEEEWENIIDERAEEEVELNDAKTKDIPWNRLMPNKDTFSEKQANVIINNPDLFL